MDRAERFYKICRRLNQGKPVSTATLLETLEPCSRATLLRDLDYLKLHFNAPIVHDRKQSGYRLEPADARVELPGLWFTESEAHALMVFNHLLSKVQPGFLEGYLQPVSERIERRLQKSHSSLQQVQQRIRVLPMNQRKVNSRYFELISHSVIQRKRLWIDYYNRDKNEHSQRVVSPQRLVYYRDNWYLDAYCHLRTCLRTFALDGVESVRVLDKITRDISEVKLDWELGDGYGIFSGKAVHTAVLRFTPRRAQWVKNECWHPLQTGVHGSDGSYTLSFPYSDHRELLMDILKYGPDVEVLGPKLLRAQVREALKQAICLYE